MKRLLPITGILLAAMLLLASCASSTHELESRDGSGFAVPGTTSGGIAVQSPSPVAPAPPPEITVSKEMAPGEFFSTATVTDTGFSGDRMIVRTGQLALIVDDVNVAVQQITDMANGYDGYVVSSQVWKVNERLVGSISIRVPAERYDGAVQMLHTLAQEVTSETSNSRDVTEEYTDLTSQLKNLEATEQQLLAILQKADTVEDILNVQRELSRTQGQIEQTKGRMQYLERTSATSLIDISLQQSKLSVEFTAGRNRLEEREQTTFFPQISGGFAPYSYEWDLGDGTKSTEQNVTHAYTEKGTYTVTLTVSDDRGNSETKTREDYITVISGWEAGNTFSSAWNGLTVFGHGLANFLIWLLVFSPLWLVIGGATYLVIRRRRKKQQG